MKRLLLLFLLCFGLALPGVAADGTSFNPTTISVKSVGASIPVGTVITWPSNSWPSDRDNWLECNGQSISSAVYPELVGGIGSRVPDYRGRFLRGLQSGHSVGQTVANSIKSHNHTQPTHTHSFSGQLVSTALSGTAAGQSFSSAANLGVSGWAAGQSITSGGAGGQTYQAVQSSGGTWISISQTGNDSGIAGGRVSIQRTTEEALKGTSPFGDRNTLVVPGVYESRSGGGGRVHCRWFFHSSRNDFRRFDLGQHRRRKHFRYGQWHSKRNDQCQRRFWGTSKWKCKRKYRCRWGNPYRLYGRSRDST